VYDVPQNRHPVRGSYRFKMKHDKSRVTTMIAEDNDAQALRTASKGTESKLILSTAIMKT
jgi:hypothetical protein